MQALSKRNDSPETASRPYSVDRDGFVMGEGAACLVLETEEHAKARGAKIYGEIVGGGVTADSYHITAPEPEGLGASRAVRLALEQAGATPDDVTHINAHATSTPTGDIAEYKALLSVFGDRIHEIPVSATKASTGHLLGGTGRARGDLHDPRAARPAGSADDQPVDAGSRDPAAHLGLADPAGRRPAARDQQLVRLRRPQRRRRVPLGLTGSHPTRRRPRIPASGSSGASAGQAAIRVLGVRDRLLRASVPAPLSPASSAGRSPAESVVKLRHAGQPTLCSHTTGASSLAWRNGSSSSSHAAPSATSSSRWSSTGSPAATSIA